MHRLACLMFLVAVIAAAVVAVSAAAAAGRATQLGIGQRREGATARGRSPHGRLPPDWPSPTTHRPLIGVLSQPGDGDDDAASESYIAASYVKLVEGGGGRVVPFLHDMPAEEIKRRFDLVHGFLIPGGAATLRPGHSFFDAAASILDLAAEDAAGGGFFPVYGVCLGFEALSIALARNASLLSRYDAEDGAAPLWFTGRARDSRLYGSMDARVVDDLEAKPYARESHSWGVSLQDLVANPALASAVDVLSLSADPGGGVYVSSWEHVSLPVWATQFHPEKNAYEWGDALHIPHSGGAVRVTQAFANYLVAAARRAGPGHGVSVEAEAEGALDDLLIYNFSPVFTGAHGPGKHPVFDEAYVFKSWKAGGGKVAAAERRRRA